MTVAICCVTVCIIQKYVKNNMPIQIANYKYHQDVGIIFVAFIMARYNYNWPA